MAKRQKANQQKDTRAKASTTSPLYINSAGNQVVTSAPQRPSHIQGSYVDAGSGKSFNTRFVPGAMMPGQQGYDAATGGGVWVAGGGTDEDVRAWYRSQDPTNVGMDQAIAKSGKDASAFTLDGLYGSSGSGASSSAASQPGMQLKDAKGLGQAIRIAGAGRGNITNKELMQIGKQFDAGSDKVIRRLDKVNDMRLSKRKPTYALGGNAYNKLTSSLGMFDYYGDGAIGQAVRAGKPQLYGNQNDSRGMTEPLRVRKGVSVTGLTAKGDIDTRERFLGTGGFNRPKVKAAKSTTTATTGSTSGTSSATQDMGGTGMVGMATAAAKEATENLGPGGLFGGGMGAAGATRLGRAKSRLRQLGIYGRGTNLLSRGLQYGNTLNR